MTSGVLSLLPAARPCLRSLLSASDNKHAPASLKETPTPTARECPSVCKGGRCRRPSSGPEEPLLSAAGLNQSLSPWLANLPLLHKAQWAARSLPTDRVSGTDAMQSHRQKAHETMTPVHSPPEQMSSCRIFTHFAKISLFPKDP